jgi:hypothetical protein
MKNDRKQRSSNRGSAAWRRSVTDGDCFVFFWHIPAMRRSDREWADSDLRESPPRMLSIPQFDRWRGSEPKSH